MRDIMILSDIFDGNFIFAGKDAGVICVRRYGVVIFDTVCGNGKGMRAVFTEITLFLEKEEGSLV